MAVEIRPFTRADVPFGQMLSDAEGWPRTASDWARLVRLEPGGAFMAVADGMPAGTAAAITFGELAWIHSVIVEQDLRGRGIGKALLRACLDFVDRRGVTCTKLDSQEGAEGFYVRAGFRAEYPSWRLLATGAAAKPRNARVRARDRTDLLAFDRASTGLDRSRALEALLTDYPDRAFVARTRGQVRGFILVRRGDRLDPIGPWVADPEDPGLAADLLRSAMSAAPGRQLRLCVGGYHDASLHIAEELGFRRESHSTRMFRGAPFEESRAAFAMISAEKG